MMFEDFDDWLEYFDQPNTVRFGDLGRVAADDLNPQSVLEKATVSAWDPVTMQRS